MAERAIALFELKESVKIMAHGGGDISRGVSVKDGNGNMFFIKYNFEKTEKELFRAEFDGLLSLAQTDSGLVIPRPLELKENALLMEYIDIKRHQEIDQYALGVGIGRLHLHARNKSQPISQFGYDRPTCCGEALYLNDWKDSWPVFYFEKRLQVLVERLADAELADKINRLADKTDQLFSGAQCVPSLVHGDLWSGNYAQVKIGQQFKPAIFDPGCFYAHDEFEFGMISLFGGVTEKFYRGYRSLIPEAPGFKQRVKLYRLFHLLNHWAHFGGGYKSQSLSLLDNLLQ